MKQAVKFHFDHFPHNGQTLYSTMLLIVWRQLESHTEDAKYVILD